MAEARALGYELRLTPSETAVVKRALDRFVQSGAEGAQTEDAFRILDALDKPKDQHT